MTMYKFDCGCEIPIIDEKIKPNDGLPSMEIDYYNINHKCPATWSLFCEGKTKGIFQLEKSLGKAWSEKMKPVSIEEVSALVSIIRPGTLKAIVDGKSMTRHFVDRKNGEEEFEYFHPDAAKILDVTYGVVVYQEQTLALAKLFAGYNLAQADILRRAMGKKKADVMAQCRTSFIDGCHNKSIISGPDAEALFDIIEKSNRYSFNKAHGTGYAETAYWCAYAKAHFPIHFFCSWLSMAHDKQKPLEEISELVQDAKSNGIDILGPSLFVGNKNFVIEDKKIRYGIGNVKGVGNSSVVETLLKIHDIEVQLNKPISTMSWYEMLVYILPKLKKSVVSNLIGVGALSKYDMHRNQMTYEYLRVSSLTDRELDWIKSGNFSNIIDAIASLHKSSIPNVKRKVVIESLKNELITPASKLNDTIDWVSNVEETLLGISLTCSKLDGCDVSTVNCSCKDYKESSQKNIIMSVQLSRVSEWRPKDRPDPMAFLTGRDNTGSVEMMVSQKEYKEYGFLLFQGNTVIVTGTKNKDGKFIVKKVTQI